ncbi:DUF1971 domain-containing protein [Robiginitomaculum antarcticum]|uniref:DUF1971 domain-containing protein n=1 Tax=Robiginitomaculum antarcticum TaxID=437507 RepID=UPI0003756DD3|nr:DUF1971 domain-containing protein [Robiginitomaculum antarcticum]
MTYDSNPVSQTPKSRGQSLSRWENEGGLAPPPLPQPYKCTPIFDENTLPAGLRKTHRTKAGVWGIIRVLQGRLRYRILDPVSETVLDIAHPGRVMPGQPHLVEPLGAMRMLVEFYNHDPDIKRDHRPRRAGQKRP